MRHVLTGSWVLGEFLLSHECRTWLHLTLKPLAVLTTLALFLWLGTWFDTQIANHVAHAETIPTCSVGEEYDAGLCYPKCQNGYDGVGPVCWQTCPAGYKDDGAFCRLDAHIYSKHSYGRGAGTPLTCGPNQELNGGLCYPRCAASHYGVGPVCWQRCPAGYADHGATCYRGIFDWFFKNTYGRGGGQAVHTCAAGLERNGALCYPKCRAGYTGAGPVCWQNCPLGYKDDGALCRKDAHIFAKQSAGRGVGRVPACEVNSFTRDLVAPNAGDRFTLLIASDPQLPWWTNTPSCNADVECEKRKGIETNRQQTRAMNNIVNTETFGPNGSSYGKWPSVPHLFRSAGAEFPKPLGVIINGDLTAFWHDWQVDLYRQFYDPGAPNADRDVLRLPVFPGLGNHDYANNVTQCQGLALDTNYCAKQAVQYIKGMVACGTVENFNAAQIKSFDRNSLAYSWQIGDWHFVQLHNYPTYNVSAIDIQPSLPWLKQDLAAATAAGKKIIINMHDLDDAWNQGDAQFGDAIKGANIVAIFAGHLHEQRGFTSFNAHGNRVIPAFHSGAAEYNTFLLAEFGNDYMNVGVVDSKNEPPTFLNPSDSRLMMTVPANDVPEAKSVGLRTPFNTPLAVDLVATDTNGDQLTYEIVTGPSFGQLAGTPPNLTYTPNNGFSGVDSITFKVNDRKVDSAPATVNIEVLPQSVTQGNQAPVATDVALTMNASSVISVTVFCTDPENDPLRYNLVGKPAHGLLQWVGPNLLTYTPDEGFVGQDHFSYKANDGLADSNVSNVVITVNAVNQAPTASDQSLTVQQDITSTLTLTAVEPDGDPITYTLVTTPTYGVLSGAGPLLLYTPHAGYNGTDSFRYKVNDGQVDSNTATVTLNVQTVNTPPVATDLQVATTQENVVALILAATDVNSDTLQYILVNNPVQGTLSGVAPDLIYTPNPGFSGIDSFRYTVNDGQANANEATVTITVAPAPTTGIVVGALFEDANRNGQTDEGETPFVGVTVLLQPQDDAQRVNDKLTSTTDNSGAYRFDGVPFGSYTLSIHAPVGMKLGETIELPVTVSERTQLVNQPIGVQVISRSIFLPTIQR